MAGEGKSPHEAFMDFFSATVGDSRRSPAMLIPTSTAGPERQRVGQQE